MIDLSNAKIIAYTYDEGEPDECECMDFDLKTVVPLYPRLTSNRT